MVIQLEGLSVYLLVFVRFAGMLAFNPLLARRNIPAAVRSGFALALTLVIAPTLSIAGLADYSGIDMVISIVKELFAGFVIGYVFQIYYEMLLFAGDLLDTDFGMSMAKVFDPGTNMQVSITGKLLTFVFVGYFFATDSHLAMIKLFASTFDFVAPGAVVISTEAARFCIEMFVAAVSLAMRLALPFMAAEFILQVAMGVLTRLVPQITVFVINFQLKQGLGLIMMFMLAPIIGSFMDNYMVFILDNLQRAAQLLI